MSPGVEPQAMRRTGLVSETEAGRQTVARPAQILCTSSCALINGPLGISPSKPSRGLLPPPHGCLTYSSTPKEPFGLNRAFAFDLPDTQILPQQLTKATHEGTMGYMEVPRWTKETQGSCVRSVERGI